MVTLESAGWEGGRLLPGSGSDKVLYVVKDHLGSVRVVKDGAGNIRQRFDYYPYGTVSRMWTASSTTDSSEKRYRFGGKEIAGSSLTDLAGYGAVPGAPYLDFGARLYSPRTATWMSVDPLMEKYYGVSPFVYCVGNPINLIDPKGCIVGDYYNLSGNYIGSDGIDDGKKYLVLDYDEAWNIKKTNKANGTTPTTEVKSSVLVPSNSVVTKMEEAYVETENDGNERGFRVGQRGYITSFAVGNPIEVDMTGPINELLEVKEYATLEVHTHPMGTPENYGAAEPSDKDKKRALTFGENVVLGYNWEANNQSPNTIGGQPSYTPVRE